uniref:Uncharacterized protein n=1 Tax=Avena sativa TaxID=4498 RepID=A0ACD5YRD2_AVESA
MEYHWFHEEDGLLQNFMLDEEPDDLLDFSFSKGPFYTTQNLSCSTIQSSFLQAELDDLHGDIPIPWPALEEGAHHKGDKELKQELGGEEALFSLTHYLCTSTTTAQSCFSQDSVLTALEGAHHKGEKNLKQEIDRDTGKKTRTVPEEKPLLTFELVAQYFCLPIKKAAAELNVGLTHLKRRCREVGIPRWPHRKVKSLETLIKNAQELGKGKIEVERLQEKKRLIEERPGHVELDEETKVLRQACFKEKFKRRRLVAIQG